MRVALNAHFWGRETTGSGQYLHRLVSGLRTHCPDLDLVLVGDTFAHVYLAEVPPPPGVDWRTVATPFDKVSPDLAKVWFEQIGFPRAARAAGAELIHIPYFAPPLWSPLPTVVTIHDLIPLLLPEYRGRHAVRLYSALVARASRRSSLVLVDSNATRRDALRLLELPPARVRTVYLGVDERYRPQPPSEIERISKKLRLPETFVLYLGGFDVRKQVPILLEAAGRSKLAWPVVIAGRLPAADTPFTPDPRRVAAELGLSDRVQCVGWIAEADKPALLAAATLFVFPSCYEGFGLPVLEALACGTATITTTAASLPELAGDAALTVAAGDAVGLADAIDGLLSDETRRRCLADRGPIQAASFTWARCAAETAEAYAQASVGHR